MTEIKAIIQKIVDGEHGPFVVATSEEIQGSITFSLEEKVWQEKDWPEKGMVVVLSELRKKRAGWRAMSGRFFKPSDEQTEISKKKGEIVMECKRHKPEIHEIMEMIAYGMKHKCRPTTRGNIRLSCEAVDKIISMLPKCRCHELRYTLPGPILSPEWGMMGEAGLECSRCYTFLNHDIYRILKSGKIEITEVVEIVKDKLPETKEDADKFLGQVEWDEGKRFFSEMKRLAQKGDIADIQISGVYPKIENEFMSNMGGNIDSLILFGRLISLWSNGKLGISKSISMGPKIIFHLTNKLDDVLT